MVFARFFLFLSFFVSFWGIQAEAQTLLSYEQFLSLSEAQKLVYISSVRDLALALSRNPELVSSEDLKARNIAMEHLLGQLIPPAQAGEYENTDRACEMKSAKNLSNEDLLSAFALTLNCTEIQSDRSEPVYFRPVAIQRVEVMAAEFFSRVEAKTISPKTKYYYDGIGSLQAAISEIKKNGTRSGQVSSSWMSSTYSQLSQLEKNTPKSGKVKSLPVQNLSKNESPKELRTETASAQNRVQKPEAQSPTFKHQCLYAGFVIPKSPNNQCKPHQKLPFNSDFFDEDSFVCPTTSQILCNPLLFGFEETECQTSGLKVCAGKKPICVFRSQDATLNCYNQAKQKKTLKQTLEIWKSSEGERLYRDYVESLEELCDSNALQHRKLKARALRDITKTCSVAFTVLKDQIQNELLPSNVVSPGTETNSSNR